MNRIRVFTSGALLLFSIYCLLFAPQLPFQLPHIVYTIAFLYFAWFPIKDMCNLFHHTLYKGRQFAKQYIAIADIDQKAFNLQKRMYDHRAVWAMVFWISFVTIPGALYLLGYIDKSWIFLLFCLSNFSVFFAIFGWCPFHSIFIKPSCCMECRIYNWDSFFQYSFLIFFPHPYTYLLFALGVCSLLKWEYMHARYPKHFYKMSNQNLTCEACDLENCRQHKKRLFHKVLKEEYRQDHEKVGK